MPLRLSILKDGGLMKSEIKTLGRRITKDLDITNGYDALNKWMINYIAEQMHIYDSAETEEEKRIAGERCSDTIMKFWRHRFYNTSWYPFSGFKELYEGLSAFLDEEAGLDFIDDFSYDSVKSIGFIDKMKKVKKVTYLLVEAMIEDEYNNRLEDGVEEWINITKDMDDGDDARILDKIADFADGRDKIIEEMLKRQISLIEDIITMYCNMLERKKQIIKGFK